MYKLIKGQREHKKLEESAGDMRLRKFIIIFTKPIQGVECKGEINYSNSLGCYYLLWYYTYNWMVDSHEMANAHYDHFQAMPAALQDAAEETNTYVGGTTTYTGKEKVVLVAGLGSEVKDRKVKAFVEKVFPDAAEYNYDRISPFDISF